MLFWLLLLIVVGTTIWVGFDSAVNRVSMSSKSYYSSGTWLAWVLLCLLLWIVGFPLYLVRRSRTMRASGTDSAPADDDATRKCPYCAENIKAQAVVCRYCGRDVEPLPEVQPLEAVPTALMDAYLTWQSSMSEKNFVAFQRVAAKAVPYLPPDTTAAQLEATFPDIPVDFHGVAARIPSLAE